MRLILIAGLCCIGNVTLAYDLLRDGALADVRFHVCDDHGALVADVEATLCFQKTFTKATVVKCKTDEAGFCSAKERSIGELRAFFRKDGYYETSVRPAFRQWDWKKAQEMRKWSDCTMESEIVIKKKISPVMLKYHSVDFKPFPATNEVVKLDLESFEWCPPYGNGRHADVHFVFDGWRNPRDWDDYHEHLKVSFPNAADGAYQLSIDPASAFKYAYRAETNAVYEKEFEFRHVHTVAGIMESRKLPPDAYLVYRVRTQTNELGQVVHARYGRIGEKFTQYFGLTMKSWFNPTDNDTNLEHP